MEYEPKHLKETYKNWGSAPHAAIENNVEVKKNTKPLNEEQIVKINKRREKIFELFPELAWKIKELNKEGMIDGWRSVVLVEDLTTGEKF